MNSIFPVSRFGLGPLSLMNEMDSVFDQFFNPPARRRVSNISNVPRANVVKGDNSYTIELAAPGFSRGDFDINITNNALTISVDSDVPANYASTLASQEYSYSSFERSWSLPDASNVDGITASYEAGILRIEIPTTSKRDSAVNIKVD